MRVLLRLTAGLAAWAAAFCLIYGLHGIGCARGWDAAMLRAVLIAAWGVSVATTVAIAVVLTRRRATHLDRAAVATGWVGVAATIVTFVPVVTVPACV